MIALLGRALARAGVSAVCLDLYGTGDSDGEFRDATWAGWVQDVRAAAGWVCETLGEHPDVLGIRSGALLALDAITRDADSVRRVILWAPTPSGKTFLTQFLRVQLAAAATFGEAPSIGTRQLWRSLEAGERVEVAGYEISSELAMPLSQLTLENLLDRATAPTSLIEVAPDGSGVSATSQRLIERYAPRDSRLSVSVVRGDPFWATAEIVEVPQLVDLTVHKVLG